MGTLLWGSSLVAGTRQAPYKVSLEAGAGLGADIEGALNLLGLTSLSAVELTISSDMARSPTATVMASRSAFQARDTVRFTLRFDPARKDFFPGLGPYNIKQVFLARRKPGELTPSVVASATASAGPTEFTIPFTATDSGSTDEFTAFVETTLLPAQVLSLELGKPSPVLLGEVSAQYSCVDDPQVCDWVRVEKALLAYTESEPGTRDPVPGLDVHFSVIAGASCVGASGAGRTDAQGHFEIAMWPTSLSPGCGQTGGQVRLELRGQDGGVVFELEWPVNLED